MGESEISELFTLALSLEYIVIIHRDSQGIIFIKPAYNINLDPTYIELFRTAVKHNVINLPKIEGEIEHATLEGKYTLTKVEKDCWITIILNQKPTRFARDALNYFSEEFETHFGGRIRNLYSKFQGDISIFKQQSITKRSIDAIIENTFHLSLKLPYKIAPTKNKDIPERSKKLYNIAKNLSRKNKKIIYLEQLFNSSKENLDYDVEIIINSILNLVELKIFVPISTKVFEEQQI